MYSFIRQNKQNQLLLRLFHVSFFSMKCLYIFNNVNKMKNQKKKIILVWNSVNYFKMGLGLGTQRKSKLNKKLLQCSVI